MRKKETRMSNRTAPLKIAVLCSYRAPGLVPLLNTDPRRGPEYEIVCCVSASDTFDEEVRVERRGVPCLAHPIRSWCSSRGVPLRDLDARQDFDRETLKLLEPFNPDLLLLDGYLLVLTEPVLRRFAGRIVNIHHSDLADCDAQGLPKFPGLRAVRDAILAGRTATRATAHIVTERLDAGPVLLRSWQFPVASVARWALAHGAADVLRASIWAHQEWMLREGWPVMLARAIELAGLSLQASGRPLSLQAGRWLLDGNRSLAPEVSDAIAPASLVAAG
jgi:folate-dependent phosphoribosylglycinamide formyltransferase PurN